MSRAADNSLPNNIVRSSLSAKITAIVFWGLVIGGGLATALLLRNTQEIILDRYERNADRVAFSIFQIANENNSTTLNSLEKPVMHLMESIGTTGVVISHGVEHVTLGKIHPDSTVTERTILLFLGVKRVGGMANILVYHTNLKQAVSDTQKMYLIVMGISLLIFGLFMGWILRKILTRPFESMVATAQALSKGVTDARFSQTGNDEFGYLSNFFNHTLDKLFSQQEKLEHMAYYDHLTQIPNRVKFISHVERSLERTKQQSDYMFAVLFIDLDRFKVINDSLGHAIGDELLIEVAHRLEECTRPTDQVSHVEDKASVARFGGDEFAVFLHDVKDISSASRVADRIQAELQEPILIDTHELYTSASIGIALSASGYEKAEDIMRDADSAMYRAKATGKAHAEIFDEAMHVSVTKLLQLETDLRVAVDREQFVLYYQPVVSAKDHRITGVEALVRWNHPEQGLISPIEFIPVAEETGLISSIGEWVLRTACVQNKAWQDAGYPNLLMKINFSARQFQDNNLSELVKIIIRDSEMPAQLLDIEITETTAMENTSIEILNQLTAMGLQTSIDDFGTGYSSLGSLKRFPINTIKIDRAFVKDINVDLNADAIIKAIIAMAHSLNMEVVAEGVETEEQLAFLQSQKCDKIQGYFFSPPVPEEDFRKLLEQEKNGSHLIQKHSESIV